MKNLIALCLLFVLFIAKAAGQNTISVNGIVVDTSGNPISGVSVKLSSKIGTITNGQGAFSISGPTNRKTIQVSYVGFETQNYPIASIGDSTVRIVLKPQKADLNEVVVIGVQRQNPRTSISAVSGIVAKDIEDKPVASVDMLLQGRVAGTNVQISSGEPGVAPTVSIRGNSTINTSLGSSAQVQQAQSISGPLYVIDGIPMDPNELSNNTPDATGTNFLAGLNINDIESVQVQRDATATAAWGARGANGVISITTKKGKSIVPIFDVNTYFGYEQKSKLLPTVTGAEERRLKMSILEQYHPLDSLQNIPGGLPQMLSDSLNPYYNNATDWQGPFYRSGNIKNADLSMSAASENVNYRLSLNYYNEQGLVRLTGFQRYSVRGNFNFKINSKLNSQFIIGLVKSNRERGMKYSNDAQNTPFDGTSQPSSFYPLNGFDSSNYLGLASKLRNINNDDNYSASLTLNYDIFPGLRYVMQGSANIHMQSRDYFQPSNLDAIAASTQGYSPSYAEADRNTYSTYLVTNNLNYTKTLNKGGNHEHHLNFTASQQYSSNVSNTVVLASYNTPTNDIKTVTGVGNTDVILKDANNNPVTRSDYGSDAMLSFMGQVQYDYNGRYLLYASDRADASSRFGADNKWGTFPAVGAGWIMSDEKFMDGVKNVITFLKFRTSYGITGQQASYFYAPFNSYNVSGTYNGNIAVQPNFNNGLTKNNLTWSKQYMKDLGFDATLFNNRINLTVDIYDKLTKNDFFTFTLPFYTGYASEYFNAKDLWVSNKGLEVTLNTNNLSPKSPLKWHSTFVLSYNKNIIARLPNNNQSFVQTDYYGFDRIYRVGQPINEFFQMQYQGVYNNQSQIPFNPLTGNSITYFKTYYPVKPGFPIWKDQNGDYDVWTGEDNGDGLGDRVPTGNPNPKFTGGFTNDFTYKNLTLTVSSVFTWKRTVVNSFAQNEFNNAFGSGISGFAAARLPDLSGINYWTPEKAKDPNYKADFPSLDPTAPYYYEFFAFSNMWNVDGSYFKVKFVTLNYMLPKSVSDRLKLRSINVYGMMSNVLTLKNKRNTMPDPEAVDQLGVYTGGLYPQPKVYTVGIDVRF